MESSELAFAKKNITSGDSLQKCSYIINMKEWLPNFETVDHLDKSCEMNYKNGI
jgi:hypothetical protein